MKIRKILVISLSALLLVTAGCNVTDGGTTMSFTGNSLSQTSDVDVMPTDNVSSKAVSSNGETSSKNNAWESSNSSTQSSSKVLQNDSDWVAYDTNKDHYKLHIRKKDGSEDKVIVNDVVLAPCVAGEWVYYIDPLIEIDKVKLDSSQKTKVCSTDAFQVYNVNLNTYHGLNGSTSITAEYLDGYILYTCFQLHEVGDKSNPTSYYKLDPNTNKITEVKAS